LPAVKNVYGSHIFIVNEHILLWKYSWLFVRIQKTTVKVMIVYISLNTFVNFLYNIIHNPKDTEATFSRIWCLFSSKIDKVVFLIRYLSFFFILASEAGEDEKILQDWFIFMFSVRTGRDVCIFLWVQKLPTLALRSIIFIFSQELLFEKRVFFLDGLLFQFCTPNTSCISKILQGHFPHTKILKITTSRIEWILRWLEYSLLQKW